MIMDRPNLYVLAEAATGEIRMDTFGGKEYMVVPVVALVEGVLQSANSQFPELALASEFGKYPSSWDGRPVVMNHPKIEGFYVSANVPTVLEEWAYGYMFNTVLDGKKLKTEAWIDLGRVAQKAEDGIAEAIEMQNTVERIQSGELVEVSTGLFTEVINSPGTYQGNEYKGVWKGIAPDHLAFLSEGTIGACSVEDGCGVPRLNLMRQSNPKTGDCGCGCGGEGACNTESEPKGATMSDDHESEPKSNSKPKNRSVSERLSRFNKRVQSFFVNDAPSDMPFDNIHKLVRDALLADGIDLWAIHNFTQEKVVYEPWEPVVILQRSYSVTDNGQVTLGDDVEEVNILTRIVPKVQEDGSEQSLNAAEAAQPAEGGNPEETDSQGEDDTMADKDKEQQGQTQEGQAQEGQTQEGQNQTVPDATSNPDQTPADKQVQQGQENENEDDGTSTESSAAPNNNIRDQEMSTEDYIRNAPPEIREVLNASLKLHQDRKNSLVEALKSNSRNKFSEEQLRAMDMAMLENLAELANVPSYEGVQRPHVHQVTEDDNRAPKPLEAFPRKVSEAS